MQCGVGKNSIERKGLAAAVVALGVSRQTYIAGLCK